MPRASRDVIVGEDGRARCFWCGSDEDYIAYHDDEWGLPVEDDRRLFEKICLEGFQSGLSWLTILRKREAFRRAFSGFDPAKVARYGARDVTRLLADPGIVRHRGKIESTIGNAKRALELIDEHGSIAAFVWKFEPEETSRPKRITRAVLARLGPAKEAVAMSKDLRSRGFTFVGPTTAYAFMQAMGLVNDHVTTCAYREKAQTARRARLRTPK
jgi:DNA-3-methyladenine glycosylase I